MIIILKLAAGVPETPGNVCRLIQYFEGSLHEMQEVPHNRIADVKFLGQNFGTVYFYDAEIKDIFT